MAKGPPVDRGPNPAPEAPPRTNPYTRWQFVNAVNLAALLGWLCAVLPLLVVQPTLLPVLAAYGIPLALLACWIIGAPILKRVMRHEVSLPSAALWGAGIAGLMAALSIAFGRYDGWRRSQDDTFFSQRGGGDYVREIDGILTPFGWLMLAGNTALFVLAGAGVGAVVWAVTGPPRRRGG